MKPFFIYFKIIIVFYEFSSNTFSNILIYSMDHLFKHNKELKDGAVCFDAKGDALPLDDIDICCERDNSTERKFFISFFEDWLVFLALSKLKIALLKLCAFIFWETAMSCPVNFVTIFKAEIWANKDRLKMTK